jgi:hypothetical protein
MASPSNSIYQIFCFYTGTGIFFVYIYNLTFFGAFLAVFGELEEKGYHGLFFCVSKDTLKILEASTLGLKHPTFETYLELFLRILMKKLFL